ncbi:MAG: trimethylamine methyltransferase family protein [Anaerolineae bacterium]|nr:trimethylamine methyltransferase family protein [Anaerolineae bacterium]
MTTGGLQGGQYKPLNNDQLHQIHETALRVLEEIGMQVNNSRALEIFASQGAKVDWSGRLVKLPSSMVEDALVSAPSSVVLCGREEKHDLILEDGRVYMGTGGTALNVLDLSGRRRRSSLEDVRQIARLVDALKNIHFYLLPVYPNELPKEIVDVNRFYAGLANTTKHVMGGVYTLEGMLKVIEMAERIAGGAEALRERPIISFITLVISPLKLDDLYGEMLIEIARRGIPVAIPSEPQCGSTAPVTLAGHLVLFAAETLCGVTLAQLVNPGTPVLCGHVGTIADMRTMSYVSGAVEMGLMDAAGAQLAQFWQLPYYATAGMSDAKVPDVQAGYESAITLLPVALAGANYIHDAAGLLDFALTASYEKYVIDDEIIGMVLRALRGIEVSEDSLAFDVIAHVGPGGHFLAEKHTIQHMRHEFFYPQLSDRSNYDDWAARGAKDGRERAREMAEKILAEHQPLPIASEVERELRESVPGLM